MKGPAKCRHFDGAKSDHVARGLYGSRGAKATGLKPITSGPVSQPADRYPCLSPDAPDSTTGLPNYIGSSKCSTQNRQYASNLVERLFDRWMQRPDTDENEEKQKNRGAERKKHSLREGPSLKVRTFAQSSFSRHRLRRVAVGHERLGFVNQRSLATSLSWDAPLLY
jgi:hypothetical protein